MEAWAEEMLVVGVDQFIEGVELGSRAE